MAGGAPTILVVMGVSGSGKSTVAGLLAERLGWELLEGDDLHPAANIRKMSAGEPLTDADREPWLAAVAAWMSDRRAQSRSAVVACSALRRRYRDVLRVPGVVFVYLTASEPILGDRMRHRAGHYMPPSLLGSQLALLEPPGEDEVSITVDARLTPDEEVAQVLARLGPNSWWGVMD